MTITTATARMLRSVLSVGRLSSSPRKLHVSSLQHRRHLTGSNAPGLLKNRGSTMPPRPKPPPADEIEESFLKGSGPGGQKINKTNSAVQLKHLPTGLVIKSQATRSRSQNRTIARQLLADKLDDLARGGESRNAVVGEFKRKKKASSAKKSRRKYRKLEEEGSRQQDDEEEVDGIEEAEEKQGKGQEQDQEESNEALAEMPNDLDRPQK
ncbi:Uu.00g092080.m01.CDS01 [Anthostomella pinea]|uniref:Uu.00g092080.m01.CDS01 n=1 Tax=Anthostomella pinea TaxID=933095 RepID=A0AAI8VNW4_9PEZI|nr:Uu.00g092080.m01.CDS01 [Anthostomella pinea]